jgi:hypothetical protein
MGSDAGLRFIEADRVDTPAGRLNGFTVVSPTDAELGKVDGVVVDPVQRQVCYYVLKTVGRFLTHRYLLPLLPATLEAGRRTLQVDVEPDQLSSFPETRLQNFTRFSDADVVDAMFARRAIS